mmetsp:Transcript_7809/g.19955  ORF Transcript_7809/g.19955 Transcript_7809/m.19955 type:complete len:222 (-) Transcript_7809:103-768(-)
MSSSIVSASLIGTAISCARCARRDAPSSIWPTELATDFFFAGALTLPGGKGSSCTSSLMRRARSSWSLSPRLSCGLGRGFSLGGVGSSPRANFVRPGAFTLNARRAPVRYSTSSLSLDESTTDSVRSEPLPCTPAFAAAGSAGCGSRCWLLSIAISWRSRAISSSYCASRSLALGGCKEWECVRTLAGDAMPWLGSTRDEGFLIECAEPDCTFVRDFSLGS